MTFKQTAGTGAGGTQNEVFIPQLAQRYTLLFGQRMIDRNGYAQRIGVQQDGSEMRGGDIALDDRQIRLVHFEFIINIIYVIRNNINMNVRMLVAVFRK